MTYKLIMIARGTDIKSVVAFDTLEGFLRWCSHFDVVMEPGQEALMRKTGHRLVDVEEPEFIALAQDLYQEQGAIALQNTPEFAVHVLMESGANEAQAWYEALSCEDEWLAVQDLTGHVFFFRNENRELIRDDTGALITEPSAETALSRAQELFALPEYGAVSCHSPGQHWNSNYHFQIS